MSGFANTVFTLLVGWFQAVVSLIWSGLTGKGDGNILTWIGNHWIVIVIILCVVGSVVDLSVYIARWKPLVVIRSYFARKREKNIPESAVPAAVAGSRYSVMPEDDEPEPVRNGYRPLFASNQAVQAETEEPLPEEIPLNSAPAQNAGTGWPEQYESRKGSEKREVPADSPYRRPAAEPAVPEQQTGAGREPAERSPETVVRPRRRRINVSELFGNPEEDMMHFEPPKPMIDQTEAYHRPVYPRNWKENGDSSDESGIRQ